MEFSQPSHTKAKHKQPPHKRSPAGKRLTQDQVRLLERSFIVNKKLDPERKLQLADELDVPPRQVAIWYQNRRARWKTQTLELDRGTLKLKLDSAMEEKERLQKDVELLKGELRRAQDLISSFNGVGNGNPPTSSTAFSLLSNNFNCLASGDEGGSGSCGIDEDAANCCWEDDDDAAMRVDDLYACLMMPHGSGM
ncbi:hypothetical protein MLD38_000622 [Melastoma candidum]|uniref:Uncharacterized protein n=1 Tax=Melastoma candidum TaxID=119954 RepID=A0ACB9SBK0_9MYRT|nr:hypothetical protein MLD38_000622 [Melastoma candidum]